MAENTQTQGVADNAHAMQKLAALEVADGKHEFDDDGKIKRTGNMWSAAAHIITAVIGSGVLSLGWSMGQLGWVAGPIILLLFAWCTYYTSRLLCDCYRYPDPVTGQRNYIYMEAVKRNLSSKQYLICGLTQYSNLVGTSIGYTIATALSARAIQKTNCYHKAHSTADNTDICKASTTTYIAIYGVIQIILSQIKNFGELWWLSYVAAIMSFTYSFIILGLGIAKCITKSSNDFGQVKGIGHGPGVQTEPQQVWDIFIALGNIAFAYSYSMILIEIQDTIRNPPPENKQMKRATVIGISTTTFFYLTAGVTGYLAFGQNVSGYILTGFNTPYWLVDFANACVVVHLVGAYQVYTQPVYQFVELNVAKRYPESNFLNKGYSLKVPGVGSLRFNLFQSGWRTVYVIITTIIAMVIPFFNDILGIIGALGFWPLTVYFPISMYMSQHKILKFSKMWFGLQTLSLVTFLVSLAALIGSVEGIIVDVQHVSLFKAT